MTAEMAARQKCPYARQALKSNLPLMKDEAYAEQIGMSSNVDKYFACVLLGPSKKGD
jgi:hypothetical protein